MSEYIDIYVVAAGAIIWIWYTYRQHVKYEKKRQLEIKQAMCQHQYIEVESGTPLEETQDYMFAYHYVDEDSNQDSNHYYYVSRYDLQGRHLPEYLDLNENRRPFHCILCGKDSNLSYAHIVEMAVQDKYESGYFWFLTRNSRTKGDYIQRSRNNLPKL